MAILHIRCTDPSRQVYTPVGGRTGPHTEKVIWYDDVYIGETLHETKRVIGSAHGRVRAARGERSENREEGKNRENGCRHRPANAEWRNSREVRRKAGRSYVRNLTKIHRGQVTAAYGDAC